MRILTDTQEQLLVDERKFLNDLRVTLVQFGATDEDQQTLARSILQLDELFLLVIVGEFNAGKSAFINALLGKQILKEGVTPTTTQINILKHGETAERQVVEENLHVLNLPADLLRQISIVDTPGTNAVIREHEVLTATFVPRSDLVLFITSADRPFTESERLFLEAIRNWGKKVVIVINKIDILQSDEELQQIVDFVRDNSHNLLGTIPEIFPISARQALRAKNGEPQLWPTSRFEPLERYIENTLDETSRLRLKFRNPLGVGKHLVDRYHQITQSRLELLREDFEMITDVERQLDLYREDMQRDFHYRMSDIENILFEMEQRGELFFDDTFRLARIFDLINKDRIQQAFEQQVVQDTPQRIEKKVDELIDWLVDQDLRQWKAVNDHLAERRREYQARIVGDLGGGSFKFDRERLLEGLGRRAQRVVETYNKSREAAAIADNAQAAVATSLAVELGAVGLGTLVTVLAGTVAADVTGILLASAVAAIGLFIIPARRQQAKHDLREKIATMRTQLQSALRTQFEREIERSLQNINETIAPYTRFVRGEREKLEEAKSEFTRLNQELEHLEMRIESLAD